MLSDKLKELRKQYNLPQRKLAAALDIDTATYCKIENGIYSPRKKLVLRLAKILKSDEKELIKLWLADKITKIAESEKDFASSVLKLVNETYNHSTDKYNISEFRKNQLAIKKVSSGSMVSEPIMEYVVKHETKDSEKKKKLGFNDLTPKEWALLSKNVITEDDLFNPIWNDLSSPRTEYQKEHGAVFPIKLAERLIKMYSKEGDTIFDPFLGIGSTIIAAHNLNRHAVGIELNPKFATIANNWLNEENDLFSSDKYYKVVNDDCRNMLKHVRADKIQVTITSPPYANFIQRSLKDRATIHKMSVIQHENNSTIRQYSEQENDFGNLSYSDFLEQIEEILKNNLIITKPGGYSCWIVKDYRDTKNKVPYVPFHSDLAKIGKDVGWKYHDLIIWDQTGQRRLMLLGYPSILYTNQNCSFIVIFRKVND